ncbi:hypothetical protein D9619_002070 [Psilocybe cf. subviscida]|uniref:Major facilitator superfamily (MFS) profile domain-containing protein n=1 Tax=Psilocybe cf. subviscida TaxID=2480587 RepID=A0A8H5BGB3_9AGAR|nr:hypothetical protein D9619_002070 [Psilocybe cf. subviscida]
MDSSSSTKYDEELELSDSPRAGLLGGPDSTSKFHDGDNHASSRLTPLTSKQKAVSFMQFCSLCWALFLLGWIDGSTGPLLLRIQKVYDVGFASLTWIFVLSCGGIVFGALVNMPLIDKYGFGKMLLVSSVLWMVSFCMQSLALPYPLFVLSFAISGMGTALADSLANGFVALLQRDGDKKMGLLHAAYGAGALVAPLSATHFAQVPSWSHHYLISLALGIANCLALTLVFQLKDQDTNLVRGGEVIPDKIDTAEGNKYSQLFRLKALHLLTLFFVIYIGVEVTIGGWIVTFMTVERGGGPSSGYVASGYWGGLTAGRLLLIWVTERLGKSHALYVYISITIVLQFVVWLIPSFITGAIAVSLIGVFLGPMYPVAISYTPLILPRSLVNGAIGWITAVGATGSALLPFLTGQIANKYGIGIMQPFLVVMMVIMLGCWALVPKAAPATDVDEDQ